MTVFLVYRRDLDYHGEVVIIGGIFTSRQLAESYIANNKTVHPLEWEIIPIDTDLEINEWICV